MKNLLIATIAALTVTTAAYAQEVTWGGYGEYQIEAEVLEFGVNTSYNINKVTLSAEAVVAKPRGADIDLDSMTIGAAYAVHDNASLYTEVEFDSDLKYQETTVGASFKF